MARWPKNRWLTPASERFLIALRDSEEQYAIQEGREVWIDHTRFHPSTVAHLLRLCLVRSQKEGGTIWLYTMNEEGLAILADANYEPKIVKAMPGLTRQEPCAATMTDKLLQK